MTKASEKNLKGTWLQAIVSFSFPVLLVFALRWAILEPYVIPSGSMIPNLLIHDHILVTKFQYGWHWPFSYKWMVKFSEPDRGDIVVFRYPENPSVFYVKRLVGIPGDVVDVQDGRLTLNGQEVALVASSVAGERGFFYFEESLPLRSGGEHKHLVRFYDPSPTEEKRQFVVPDGHYFFMGDNRDESSDSRVWGYVNEELLLGKALGIWLSCDATLPTMSFVCDPSQMRWERFFKNLN